MEEWSPFRAYAPRRGSLCWPDLFTVLALAAGAIWFYLKAHQLPLYDWSWSACPRLFLFVAPDGEWRPGPLLRGLFTTMRVGFWTFLFSLLCGGLLGILALGKAMASYVPYQCLINLLRNTPPLILLFCVYFAVGQFIPIVQLEDNIEKLPDFMQEGISLLMAQPGQMDKMAAAVLALGLYQAAYVAEIVRGSLESVPQGQWDAGLALGFGRAGTLYHIIFPQGMRIAAAPLTGQCITTFKESSLASLISLPDLTFQSLEIMATSGMTFEVWICAGILYLLLGALCAFAGHFLERRSSRHIV